MKTPESKGLRSAQEIAQEICENLLVFGYIPLPINSYEKLREYLLIVAQESLETAKKEADQREAIAEARGRRELARKFLELVWHNAHSTMETNVKEFAHMCERETAKAVKKSENLGRNQAESHSGGRCNASDEGIINLPVADISTITIGGLISNFHKCNCGCHRWQRMTAEDRAIRDKAIRKLTRQ